MALARARRSLSYFTSTVSRDCAARGVLTTLRKSTANVAASSRPWHAPCPRFGVIACAASPMSTVRPRANEQSSPASSTIGRY